MKIKVFLDIKFILFLGQPVMKYADKDTLLDSQTYTSLIDFSNRVIRHRGTFTY